MSFLIARGLDAEGPAEVWKLKAVDFLHWSRVLYTAKRVASGRYPGGSGFCICLPDRIHTGLLFVQTGRPIWFFKRW